MSDPHFTITTVEPLEERWVRLTFADGAVHEVDLAPVLTSGGVFAPIRDDRAVFESVSVDPESHTICWPGDVDLDPLRPSRRRVAGLSDCISAARNYAGLTSNVSRIPRIPRNPGALVRPSGCTP